MNWTVGPQISSLSIADQCLILGLALFGILDHHLEIDRFGCSKFP